MAKPLTPLEKKQLSAFVEIIPNGSVHLVEEALHTGYYRGISLYDAQRTLLSHENFSEFGEGFATHGSYNREVFERFLDRIRADPRGLYDRIKRAVWSNDLDILDPSKPTQPPVKADSGELVPPHPAAVQAPPPTPPDHREGFSPEEAKKPETSEPETEKPTAESERRLPEQTQQRLDQANRSMQRTQRALTQPQGQSPDQSNRTQLSERMERQQDIVDRSMRRPTPRVTAAGRHVSAGRAATADRNRRRIPPLPRSATPTSGGVLNALNNYWMARDLASLGKWMTDKLGLRGISNLIDKFFAPERFLGNLLKDLGSLAGRGVSSLLNNGLGLARTAVSTVAGGIGQFLSGLGARTGLIAAGRGLIFGTGAVIATIGLGAVLFWTIFVLLAVILVYTVYDANTECGQPGKVELNKTADKESFDVGEVITYTIVLNYNIKCTSAYLDKVIVRDTPPAAISYNQGSAKSTKTMEIIDPTQIQDSTSINEPGSVEVPPIIDPDFPAADNITLDGNTIVWQLGKVTSNYPVTMTFSATVNQADTWVANRATAGYSIVSVGLDGSSASGGSSSGGGRIIDAQSQSLDPTFVAAAQNVNMPSALLKAIAKTEAPKVFDYNEEEFRRFSIPGWWEGLEANAPSLPQNHPDIIRGYAYNTCAYRNDCASGADVRGVTQFELATWNGIAGNLQFADGHQPDRRNASDAIFGSAVLNRKNAESYVGSSDIVWSEEVVRAVARMYCAGPAAGRNPARARVSACGWNGSMGYDDFVWRDYQIFSGQQ